jgi:predicted ATPase/DNA-binding XRE family transcriptional regulator
MTGSRSGADPATAAATTFAELLRRYRVDRSLSQEELAERARVTTKAVGALERGERRRPYPHTVRALAEALDLDDDERSRLVAVLPHRSTPRAGVATPAAATGLPVPSGLVTGRDGDVAAVRAVLRTPGRRVVTLTGPGGVGKTTLALVVAAGVRSDFPGGVVVVELADVVDAGAVMPAIGTALGVSERGFDGTARALAPLLADRRALLVLDNLEHVLSCGPELGTLAAACPDLVVLATSRAPLRIRAEQEVRVAPLKVADAARLFRERVAAAGTVLDDGERTAAAVAALCERADGLPLALELAASAAARLGPVALLDRLDTLPESGPRDLPARQRSMAATFAWSHDLLSEPARALLARLSVCAGGFSLAVAEEIGTGADVLAALAELLEHSMVTRTADVEDTERFRLLEPVRQEAAARLDSADGANARARLAAAMLDVARGLAEDLQGAGQAPALRLLEADMGNLRAAFDQFLDPAGVDGLHADAAAELLWAVWVHLAVRDHAREGIAWARRLDGHPLGDHSRARLLVARAGLELATGDIAAVRRLLGEAVAFVSRLTDDVLAVQAAVLAAYGALFEHDVTAARELLDHADHHTDLAGDAWSIHLLVARGQTAMVAGQAAEADRILAEAEVAARRLGSPLEMAVALSTRAVLSTLGGRHTEAAHLLVEALELAAASRNTWTSGYVAFALAGVAARLGEPATAAWLLGASASHTAEHGIAVNFPTAEVWVDHDLAVARESLGEAAFAEALRAGRGAAMDDVVEVAHAIRRRAGG